MVLHYKVAFHYQSDEWSWDVKAVVAIDEAKDAAWVVDADITDQPSSHYLACIAEEAVERAWRLHERRGETNKETET